MGALLLALLVSADCPTSPPFNQRFRVYECRLWWWCRWSRPLVVSKVLEKGYAVHLTDVDIAYSPFGECWAWIASTGHEDALQDPAHTMWQQPCWYVG